MTKDPVCGMQVETASAAARAEHGGRTYYFCSTHCHQKFMAEPTRYAGESEAKASPAAPATPRGSAYTCPMHPEVRQAGPGTCPKCGAIRQKMQVWILVPHLRRATARDEEVNWLRPTVPAKEPRQLKSQQGTEAMSEEGKRSVQIWCERRAGGLDEGDETIERRLVHPLASPGQFDGADVNARREARRPGAEERRAGSGEGETEQPGNRRTASPPEREPTC